MGNPAILSVKIISDAKGAVKGLSDADQAVGGFAGKLASISPGALAIGGAVIGGIVAAGKALFDLGETFDQVEDTIRVGTGATGDALEGLVEDAHKVATSVPTDFEKAGQTVADLNTRLGLSGDTLQTVASQYLEAGRILGQDVDISSTSAAFQAFGIQGDAVSGAMDELFQASQATGVSMNDLASKAQANAFALKEMGYTFGEGAALIGQLDKAGVDSQATLKAMQKGLVAVAEPGQNMADALSENIWKIQDFIKAGDDAAALDVAGKIFGTKGAPQMIEALKTGALSFEDIKGAAGLTSDTILDVGAQTQDAAEKWQILKNKGMEALRPLGETVFGFAGDALGAVVNWVEGIDLSPLKEAFASVVPWLTSFAEKAAGIGERIWPLIDAIKAQLTPVIEAIIPAIQGVFESTKVILDGALSIFGGFIDFFTAVFTGDWPGIWDGATQIVEGAWQVITGVISGAWEAIKGVFHIGAAWIGQSVGNLWNLIAGLFSSGIARAVDFVRGLPGAAASALANAGSALWDAGVNLIQGFINGIKNMAGRLASTVKNLFTGAVGSVLKLLGINSPSRVFYQIGVHTGEGMVLGLKSQSEAVDQAFTNLVSLPPAPSVEFPSYGANAPKGMGGNVYNITVNGVLDGEDAARKIRRILEESDRRLGVSR